MRLWHEALIPYLPQKQLCGQHREVCALRGNGWGKKHATVDYVFRHPYGWLVAYHKLIMEEMEKRGYQPDKEWYATCYRGKQCKRICSNTLEEIVACADRLYQDERFGCTIYPEHNDAYLKECLENLEAKGIHIDMEDKKDV